MDAARWSRLRGLLEAAVERDAASRESFVREQCGADAELRDEVLRLLANDAPSSALESPAAAWSAAMRARDDSLIGERLGRYRVQRLIGYGGMGAVYEAEQDQPRRTVALKVMRPSLASPQALQRFEFEAQVLARLRHPAIAAVFEAGTHNPDPADPSRAVAYFAMELVQNAAPITDHVRSRDLSTREVLELFAQVCDAVHHGHQQGVIHRDLKPGNLLVDGDGRPRIIDFGIARMLDLDHPAAQGGEQALGTLQYMSPEQCEPGEQGDDARTDVYSLGVVLYELLAGHRPHAIDGLSVTEALARVREFEPPPLGTIDRRLRGDLETIVRTSMRKDREQRYGAASALAADIRHYLRTEPIAARPPTAMYQLHVFARRNRPLVAAAASVLVVLVVGIVATSLAWRSSHEEAQRARRIADFYKETITAGTPYLPGNLSAQGWWEADPYEPRSAAGAIPRSFAVPDLLEVVGSRLDQTFSDDPMTLAELEDAFGRTLTNMGRERGMDLLRTALELRERHLGPDDPDTIRSRLVYAVRIEGGGRYAAAEPLFRTALASSERAFGRDDPRTLAVERRVAINRMLFDSDRGLRLTEDALEHARRALGEDDPATLTSLSDLAAALHASGDLKRAEILAREALAGWRRVQGDQARETAAASMALAGVLIGERSFVEAEPLLRAGLSSLREQLGGDIVRTFTWELQLVGLLRRTSRPAEAAEEMRHIFESARAAFGEGNMHVIKLEATLARTLLESNADLERAEGFARHAADTLVAEIGPHDLNSVIAVDTLTSVIRARSRVLEAESRATELLRLVNDAGIVEPQVLASLHQTLGECLWDGGERERAAMELREAWRIAEEGAAYASDPYHPRRLALIASLARADEQSGRSAEAQAWRAKLPDSR